MVPAGLLVTNTMPALLMEAQDQRQGFLPIFASSAPPPLKDPGPEQTVFQPHHGPCHPAQNQKQRPGKAFQEKSGWKWE